MSRKLVNHIAFISSVLKPIKRTITQGVLFILVILTLPINSHSSQENTQLSKTYVYWQGEASEARKPFESELMKLIFQLSEEKYGQANLKISQEKITSKRSIQMMKDGHRLHIQNAPYLLPAIDKDSVIVLPMPILNNLLGYRHLIIRNSDKSEFSSINTYFNFSQKIAGQGRGWADNKVYLNNGIKVMEAPNFMGMFPMLVHKRFDYIPLGVSEASETLKLQALQDYNLTIAEDLIVFYPWPIHILVSIKHPDLASRIQYGFNKAQEAGQYDKLFIEHFGQVLQELRKTSQTVILLKSPNLPENMPTEATLIHNPNYLK